MQSDVMAACNEYFPVGWTVTLWMAGDSRPWGERIRNPPSISVLRLISTDEAHMILEVISPFTICLLVCHTCLVYSRSAQDLEFVSTHVHNGTSPISYRIIILSVKAFECIKSFLELI